MIKCSSLTRHPVLLVAVALAALLACKSTLAVNVGETILVRNQVTGTLSGQPTRQMSVGDAVLLGLSLNTGKASSVRMTFDPSGALSLGAETSLLIDEPTVDRATGRKTSKLSVKTGWLRLAVGKLFNDSLEISTPTAVIGVKGTIVDVLVDPSGDTRVVFWEGKGFVRSTSSDVQVTIQAGEWTSIAHSGDPAAARPIDPSIRSALDQAAAAAGDFAPPPLDVHQMSESEFVTHTAGPAAGGNAFTDPRLPGAALSTLNATRPAESQPPPIGQNPGPDRPPSDNPGSDIPPNGQLTGPPNGVP